MMCVVRTCFLKGRSIRSLDLVIGRGHVAESHSETFRIRTLLKVEASEKTGRQVFEFYPVHVTYH